MLSVILLSILVILWFCTLKCDKPSDFWQKKELAFAPEPDLQGNVDWDKKRLVDFNAGKTQLISLDWPYISGTIIVKMDGSGYVR